MKERKTAGAGIYQLKITLKGIRPPIWRRVQVPGAMRLAALHEVIQTVFGWTDTHLHQFYIGGQAYGQPDDFDEDVADENRVSLSEAAHARIKRFEYVYDFGDDWRHEVVVERIIGGNSGSERPVCLAGKRHRPPEDCGGPWGYREFLKAVKNPGHEDHETLLESVGGRFDSEAFDLAAVNRALVALAPPRSSVQ